MKHADALAQLAREIARARSALATERAARLALWPALAVATWAAIVLVGATGPLPPLAQSIVGVAVLAALIAFIVRMALRWRRPSDAEARARLAVDSQLDIAAFEALEDRPSQLEPGGLQLWRREQERAIDRAKTARAGPARPGLDAADPYKLRYIAVLALIGAAVIAGPAAPNRLLNAFYPDPGPLLGDRTLAIEAWLTPAAYTGAAPVSLSDRIGETVEAPPRAQATVRVTGPRGAPLLVYRTARGAERVRFARAPDGAFEARIDIAAAGKLSLVRFRERAAWTIAPGPDAAPTIAFSEPLTIEEEERGRLAWTASDDYGVHELALRMVPVDPPEGLKGAAPYDIALVAPAGEPREAQDDAEVDLAEHPYAGLEVEVRLVARDALGQEGVSEPIRVHLPEKLFLQPLALAAIKIRKMILWERRAYGRARAAPGGPATMPAGDILTGTERLVIQTDDQDPRLERAPAAIQRAERFLAALTSHADDDDYFTDAAVFMGLRMARAELQNAREIGETDLAADLLWRTALRAEYGAPADARRNLELAQQAMAEALRDGASPERIAQLADALRKAMDNYLQALIQEAMRNGQPQTQEDTQEQSELSQQDLQDVLDEIERLTREGRMAEAAALLQQLAGILQNLDVQLSQGGQGQGEQQQQGEGQESSDLQQSMEQLNEAIQDQGSLNDDTQSEAQDGEQGEGPAGGAPEGQALADRQSEIRDRLNSARRQAGRAGAAAESRQELGQAERAMRRAEDALQRGDFAEARAAQDEALQSLREGANSLSAEQAQSQQEGAETGGDRDPLGRTRGGVGDGGDTQIPAEAERARSREILDELRRRAQDPQRPEAERDYLRRLLERFTGS